MPGEGKSLKMYGTVENAEGRPGEAPWAAAVLCVLAVFFCAGEERGRRAARENLA